MSKVPNAWDDDWETLADKSESHVAASSPAAATAAEPVPKITKAQRRAQHLEQQKQLWNSAENPDRFHWLETKGVVPLKQDFRPQVKLLSRQPVIAKRDAANGIAGLSLDDGDSDEESRKQREADLEERQRKAKLEREEKQRKYAEARERIMGSASGAPATPISRESSHGRETRKPKVKVNGKQSSQPTSSADQSPARPASSDKQLFDPDDMGRRLPKRESSSVVPKEDQPSRQPRGPDNSSRGGFGFAGRGGKDAA